MCRWYLKTCRKTRPRCWHHPCHVFMSPLISCPHSKVLRAPCSKPKDLGLASGPTPCEQRGQAKKVGGILAPLAAKARWPWVVSTTFAAHTLGSHTLRGKAHGLQCAQGVLCRGCREPAYCSGCWCHWEPHLLALVLGDFCQVGCWAGKTLPGSLRPRSPRIALRYVGPHRWEPSQRVPVTFISGWLSHH